MKNETKKLLVNKNSEECVRAFRHREEGPTFFPRDWGAQKKKGEKSSRKLPGLVYAREGKGKVAARQLQGAEDFG